MRTRLAEALPMPQEANRIIPAPPNTEERPFVIGDTLTIFDAAMVYAGRHPHKRFLRDFPLDERLTFLKAGFGRRRAARRSWDIYLEILKKIEQREIAPSRTAYDPHGKVDPIRSLIKTSDLADLAFERGERPRSLTHLIGSNATTPRGKLTPQQFVSQHIAAANKAGVRPTMAEIEEAAQGNTRGNRASVREAARKMLGDVKRGRPVTKFAKK
jgi:hypothetical protein